MLLGYESDLLDRENCQTAAWVPTGSQLRSRSSKLSMLSIAAGQPMCLEAFRQ
jgi:hypothetical protein